MLQHGARAARRSGLGTAGTQPQRSTCLQCHTRGIIMLFGALRDSSHACRKMRKFEGTDEYTRTELRTYRREGPKISVWTGRSVQLSGVLARGGSRGPRLHRQPIALHVVPDQEDCLKMRRAHVPIEASFGLFRVGCSCVTACMVFELHVPVPGRHHKEAFLLKLNKNLSRKPQMFC